MIQHTALFAALVLSSFSFAAPPPVALWPADRPLPTQADLDARSREFEDRLAERMERMQSARGGCGVTPTDLEHFEDIVALATSGLYEPTRIVYIDSSAPLGGDGSSWNSAYQSIQDALNAGPYDSDLVEFRLAGGTYRADTFSGFNTLDADLSIELPGLTWVDAIDGFVGIKSVKGGYAGRGAKNPDERDSELYPTVFTGDLLGDDDAENFANYKDNTKVLFRSNETELNGITIEHARIAAHELRWMSDCTVRYCFASGDDLPVEIDFRSPVFAVEARLVGNTFHNNRGETYGGAMALDGLTVVANSRFLRNTAVAGGAISSPFGGFGFILAQNCYFAGNVADGNLGGFGGVAFLGNHFSQFAHCTIVGNASIEGGGQAVFAGNGNANFRNCILDQNFAYDGTGFTPEILLRSGFFFIEACVFGRYDPNIFPAPTPRLRFSTQADPGFADLLGPDGLLGTVDDDPSLGFDSAAIGRSIAPPGDSGVPDDFVLFDLADLDADCDVQEPLPVDMLGNPRAIEGTPGEGVDGYAADAGCIEFVPAPDAPPGQPWTYVDPMITDFSTQPIRLYVDGDAPDGGDGLSWVGAFANPCPALDVAARRVGPVEIWVAAGVYAPICADSGWNGFRLRENVTLLGGFAGNEDSADERDWIANETILTGDVLGNDDIADESTFEDNAPHVLASLGARGGGVVDGFSIRDGFQKQLVFGPGFAWPSPDGLGRGGALLYHGAGDVVIRNCLMENSTVEYRMPFVAVGTHWGGLEFESSRFGPGGPTVGNTGMVAKITSNSVGASPLPPPGEAELDFRACDLDMRRDWLVLLGASGNRWTGGAVTIAGSVLRFSDLASSSPIIHSRSPSPVAISGSQISGGRLTIQSPIVRVRNSTVFSRRFTVLAPNGPVIPENFEFLNSVFACEGVNGFASSPIRASVFASTIFQNTIDQLDETNLVFDFDANAAQFFLDPLGPDGEPYTGDEDLRLAPGSPAINTGLNAFVDSEFDLDGNDRIIGSVVDRGAYEFTGTCTGDVNGDGVIDLADLNKVLANFNQPVPFGDADGSGTVDMTDLNIVIAAFGSACDG